MIISKGIIVKNFNFLILCLKIIIPNKVPLAPPKIEVVINEYSLILILFLIALYLSIPIKVKAIVFIVIIYMLIIFI